MYGRWRQKDRAPKHSVPKRRRQIGGAKKTCSVTKRIFLPKHFRYGISCEYEPTLVG